MPTVIDEGHLRFDFGDEWIVVRYDEHPDYYDYIRLLHETKAVDFVAILRGHKLYLIEVKDFRGHRIENRDRIRDGELAIEVAQKVRDTIAGIIAACHRGERATWENIIRCLTKPDPPVHVLLWLEDDLPPGPRGRRENQSQVMTRALKGHLRWLTKKVLVASIASGMPGGLSVTNLPGAGHRA